MNWYFYKDFALLIKLCIDKKGRKPDSGDILVKKATKAKIKAKIRFFAICNIYQRCYRGNQLVYIRLVREPYDKHRKKTKAKRINNYFSTKQKNENCKTKAQKEKKNNQYN